MRNQNNEKIETNNWTRLLIFDDKINFFSQPVPEQLISLLYSFVYIFLSSLFDTFKKTDSENLSTPKVGSQAGVLYLREKAR